MDKNVTIGNFLTKARKKKKMSLDDIIEHTKININVLKHLEADNFEKLPSKTYIRGFVMSYAKAVEIDQEQALEVLNNTYEAKGLETSKILDPQKPQQQNYQPTSASSNDTSEITETLSSIISSLIKKQTIYSIVAILIVVAIGKGVHTFFSQLTAESKSIVNKEETAPDIKPADKNLFELDAAKKLKTIASVEKTKVATPTEKPKLVEVKKVEVVKETAATKPTPVVEKLPAKEEAPVKKETAPTIVETEKVKVEEKKPEVKKEEKPVVQNLNGKFPFREFYPTPTNMYDLVADAPEVNDTEILPTNIKVSVVSGKQNVYIVAKDDSTWISYKVDEQKIKRYVLQKGKRVLIRGDQILLFMGNYNATKVFLNNKLVSAQTKTGVKSMIFPEENAKDFELPLFPSFNGIPYSAEEYKANMAQKAPKESETTSN